MQSETYKRLENLAKRIRRKTLQMLSKANASHSGSCLSVADILAVLYGHILKIDPARPDWSERDRFVLSKGHAAGALYATLAECGFFPVSQLDNYCKDGSLLTGHVNHKGAIGVEVSTGSLGHGLSIGAGMALAAKYEARSSRVFVVTSDGELDEGSNWEAILFAAHQKLDNLVAIVDYNKIQSFGSIAEVLDLKPLVEKWTAFNWGVLEVDGNNVTNLVDVLSRVPFVAGKPSCLIANTVKGKGVSFMENQLAWHYKSPNVEKLKQALSELE